MQREAFAEQATALRGALYYVSYSLLRNPDDQEDAVQETIRKALEKLDTLREPKYLKTWLIRILINECHNTLRRRKREFPSEALPDVAPRDADGAVFDAISALPEKHRLPLVLHHYEGYTTREIASILRVPEGTVKARLVRARDLLKKSLEEQEALA